MTIHSQQELICHLVTKKSKYTNRSHKRKKHDSNTKLKRSKSNHKNIVKQIRVTVQKKFERKYTEKENLCDTS